MDFSKTPFSLAVEAVLKAGDTIIQLSEVYHVAAACIYGFFPCIDSIMYTSLHRYTAYVKYPRYTLCVCIGVAPAILGKHYSIICSYQTLVPSRHRCPDADRSPMVTTPLYSLPLIPVPLDDVDSQ